ncbi:MAG TPA: NAD-dependent epimerase/dehydratase family protein [Coxiellaceae bacterium]|nr:NAD-dependent epimerase/dehydratase family protein [Coxiellaceae bacterium]
MTNFYTGKRVFVTGGAGFIGSHLVEMLVAQGARVTIPIRESTRLDYLDSVRDRIQIVEADLYDSVQIERAMRGQEIIINLAAAMAYGVEYSRKHHASLFRDNMRMVINVLEAARLQRVERVLIVSSACVYPRNASVPTPEEEGMKESPEPTNGGYGWSKRMGEYLAQEYVKEYGMKIAIARPFNAYGPRNDFFRENQHVIPSLLKKILEGQNPLEVWGNGQQTRSFLYVTDFARGLLEVCESYAVGDPLNIGSDEEVTVAQLAQLLIELTGAHTSIQFDVSRPEGQPRRTCDTQKAYEKIGFKAQVPLREGLKRTITWYQQTTALLPKA